ncbi:MAG: ABC-ATPase domain-containing protein [Desulfurellaceae bacterium]|nr:ABC-ATPase domain-containing protein [Desulfurellaceae bacterium]
MDRLKKILKRIEKHGYKAYNDIIGKYKFHEFDLEIVHVQGDPFATPSKITIFIPKKIQTIFLKNKIRRIAFADYLCRRFKEGIRRFAKLNRGSGSSGLIFIEGGEQVVLERSACEIDEKGIVLRIFMGLPAYGRRISAKDAEEMFFKEIPNILNYTININEKETQTFVQIIENAEYLRDKLKEKGLCVFIADDAILPRLSGISDKPLKKAVPFKSPPSLKVVFSLPDGKEISGMCIKKGVTLIVGGGFHGKSTLLSAIEQGIYNHVPEDGREYVVSSKSAVYICAENGRYIENVNIEPFVSSLPFGKDTIHFSTENASGSTSQAAAIVEAIEAKSELLLIDEDTSATNFMVRDARMQKLVSKTKEPITPFIDQVKELYRNFGISTILVMGGCGDYFDVADCVIHMDSYIPYDVTEKAQNIIHLLPTNRKKEEKKEIKNIKKRIFNKNSISPYRGKKKKIDGKGTTLIFGKERIDMKTWRQIVSPSQLRIIGFIIDYIKQDITIDTIKEIIKKIEKNGLCIFQPCYGNITSVRSQDIMAILNRMRNTKCKE